MGDRSLPRQGAMQVQMQAQCTNASFWPKGYARSVVRSDNEVLRGTLKRVHFIPQIKNVTLMALSGRTRKSYVEHSSECTSIHKSKAVHGAAANQASESPLPPPWGFRLGACPGNFHPVRNISKLSWLPGSASGHAPETLPLCRNHPGFILCLVGVP